MSTPKIANAMDFIDDELVIEAESFAPQKNGKVTAIKITAISLAACLIIAAVSLLSKPYLNVKPTVCTDDKFQTFTFAEMQTHHIFGEIFPETLPKDYHPDGVIYVYDEKRVEAIYCNHFTGDVIYMIVSPRDYFAGTEALDQVLYHENEQAGTTSYIYVDLEEYIGYFFSEEYDLATLEGFEEMIASMK